MWLLPENKYWGEAQFTSQRSSTWTAGDSESFCIDEVSQNLTMGFRTPNNLPWVFFPIPVPIPSSKFLNFGDKNKGFSSETFSGTKFFRYRFRDFFPVPNFSDTGSETFSGTNFFRYRFRYHQKNEKNPVPVRHTLVKTNMDYNLKMDGHLPFDHLPIFWRKNPFLGCPMVNAHLGCWLSILPAVARSSLPLPLPIFLFSECFPRLPLVTHLANSCPPWSDSNSQTLWQAFQAFQACYSQLGQTLL